MANLNDPISDLLTRIRNGAMAKHARVEVPGSKVKLAIGEILQKYGYIESVEWVDEGPQGKIRVTLKYHRDGKPAITKLQRVSKPSRRVYVGVDEIPPVLNGLGVAILSTPRGVLADRQARAEHVGGEILCTVY